MDPTWDDAEDITTWNIPRHIKQAREGNTESAERLCGIFISFIKAQEPCPPELLVYIAECIGKSLDGEDANKALFGKKPKHRPVDPNVVMRDAILVQEINNKLSTPPSPGGPKRTVEEVIEEVVNDFHVTEEICWHAWRKRNRKK